MCSKQSDKALVNKNLIESLKIEVEYDYQFVCKFDQKSITDIDGFHFKEMGDFLINYVSKYGLVDTMQLSYENTHITGIANIYIHCLKFETFTRLIFSIKYLNYTNCELNHMSILDNFIKGFREKYDSIIPIPCKNCVHGNLTILTRKCNKTYNEICQ